MSTWERSKKYRCFEDCTQSGCPGHEMTMSYNTVADIGIFDIGDGSGHFTLDKWQIQTFIELAGEFLQDYEGWDPKYIRR